MVREAQAKAMVRVWWARRSFELSLKGTRKITTELVEGAERRRSALTARAWSVAGEKSQGRDDLEASAASSVAAAHSRKALVFVPSLESCGFGRCAHASLLAGRGSMRGNHVGGIDDDRGRRELALSMRFMSTKNRGAGSDTMGDGMKGRGGGEWLAAAQAVEEHVGGGDGGGHVGDGTPDAKVHAAPRGGVNAGRGARMQDVTVNWIMEACDKDGDVVGEETHEGAGVEVGGESAEGPGELGRHEAVVESKEGGSGEGGDGFKWANERLGVTPVDLTKLVLGDVEKEESMSRSKGDPQQQRRNASTPRHEEEPLGGEDAALKRRIASCQAPAHVADLVSQHGSSIKGCIAVRALHRIATTAGDKRREARENAELLRSLVEGARDGGMKGLAGGDVADLLWSMWKLGLARDVEGRQAVREAVDRAARVSKEPASKGKGLSGHAAVRIMSSVGHVWASKAVNDETRSHFMDEKALDAGSPQRTAKQQRHRHPSVEARESLECIAGAVIRDADTLEAHHVIMTWDAMAYLGFEGGGVVDGISGWEGIGKALPLLNARELPRLLWAAAKTRRQVTSEGGAVGDGRRSGSRGRNRDLQPPLWGAEACRLVDARCGEMKAHQVAVCMWAIVRLGIEPGDGVMQRLASRMLKDTSPGGVRLMNLSWALWAMARCGGGVPEGWMREVADRVLAGEGALVKERGGADALVAVPQIMYALALLKGSGEGGVWDGRVLGDEAESLLDAMLLHFEDLAPRMGPQAVTNSLWAIAELGLAPSEELMGVLMSNVESRLASYNPRSLSLLLTSLARLPGWKEGQYKHISGLVTATSAHTVDSFDLADAVNLVVSRARLGERMGPTEGAVFEARISQLQAGMLPEHVAGLLWAYGRFGYRPGEELYKSLVAKGIAEAHNMSLAQCFNSLKGLARMATLKVREDELYDLLLSRIASHMASGSTLDSRNLADVLWVISKLKIVPESGLIEQATSLLEEGHVGELGHKGVRDVTWAVKEMDGKLIKGAARKNAGLFDKLIDNITENLDSFHPQSLVISLRCLAALRCTPSPEKLAALAERIRDFVPVLGTGEACVVVRAMGEFGITPSEIVGEVVESRVIGVVSVPFSEVSPQELCWTLDLCVESGYRPIAVAERLSDLIASKVYDLEAKQVASLMRSLAKLGCISLDAALEGGMVQQTLSVQRFLRPVDMSNILWAFAELRVKPAAVLVAVLTQKAIQWRGLYKAPDIANTLWAYAELNLAPSPKVIVKVMQSKQHMVTGEGGGFDNRPGEDVAAALRAITEMMGSMVLGLTERALLIADTFEPTELSLTMLSLARMRVLPDATVVQVLSERAEVLAPRFSARNVVDFLSAFIKMRVPPSTPLVEIMYMRSGALVDDFTGGGLSELLYTMSKLKVKPGDALFYALVERAGLRGGEMDGAEADKCVDAIRDLWSDSEMEGVKGQGKQRKISKALIERVCSDLGGVAGI